MDNDLSLALQHHRQGRLDEAEGRYLMILASAPGHADALHLLGVLRHQRGKHALAVDLIGRAIALRPGAPAYHGNLAEAYRALGRLDQAADCCRTALRLQPASPEAINTLGLVFLAQDQAEAAAAHFREAVRLRPDFALACNNLGNALCVLGDKEQAVTYFRRALEIDPGLAEGYSNLGQLLLERKQLEESLVHLRKAVRLRPDFPEAHSNLGNVLREMNRPLEARVCYAEALGLNPNLGMVHNNIGQALQEEGKLDDAVACYQRALQLEPTSPRIHCNLASALVEQDLYAEAFTHYETALRLDPKYAGAYNGLGWVHHEQGRYEEAQARYREALRHEPELAAAHCNLGTVREELSDFAGAERCYRAALRHDHRLPGAFSQLATLLRDKLPEADLAAMRALLADLYLSDGQRGSLHFGLAQALDARGDYAEAARHLSVANGISVAEWSKRGKSYVPALHTRFVDSLTSIFTPTFFEKMRGLGHDSERPIFIVGLPRSGTTLTEQILASHPRVFGAGELRLGHDDFDMMGDGEEASLAALDCLDRAKIRRVAERHLGKLAELDASRDRVADKMPDNYLYLGLLQVLFPRATYIHCRRDLRDVAVSCWMTSFRHIRWSSDPDHIASRFLEYQRLREHWHRVLPLPVLEVDYEETVADLAGVARRLVRWCGLEWDPACLNFHQGKRPVRTASVAQVRRPVYTRSVARWKHYEPALADLFDRLGSSG